MKKEKEILDKLKQDLIDKMTTYAKKNHLSQITLAKNLLITQPRVSSIHRKKLDEFSLDMLIKLCYRLGIIVDFNIEEPKHADLKFTYAKK